MIRGASSKSVAGAGSWRGLAAPCSCSKPVPGKYSATAHKAIQAFRDQVVAYLADHPGAIQEGINA